VSSTQRGWYTVSSPSKLWTWVYRTAIFVVFAANGRDREGLAIFWKLKRSLRVSEIKKNVFEDVEESIQRKEKKNCRNIFVCGSLFAMSTSRSLT